MKMKMTAQQIESMKDTTSARSGIRECLNGEVFGCAARNGRFAVTVILFGCLLVAFNAPVLASTTQTAISVGDTYVRSAGGTVANGSIQTGWSTFLGGTRRGLVRFNTALPGGNVVNAAGSASLVMGCYSRQVGTTTASIGLGKPNYTDPSWTEYDATWNLNSALSGAFAYQNVVSYGNYTWTWNGYNNIPGIQKGIVVWNNTSEGDQNYAKSFNDRENTGAGYSYPTLTITYNYTAPSGEPNVIRTWGYLGHFVDASDHQTRIYRNYINSTYSLVPVDEHQVAPNLANGATGPALGSGYSGPFYWKKGVSTADIVNLLSAPFYNAAAKENGATYCVTYIYYNAATKTDVYLGAGSDDCSRVWLNGNYVGYWDSPMGRGTQVDQDWYGPMTLNNGWNRLVMKVENGGGGYGVYARFANSTGAYVGNCTYFNYDASAPSAPTSLAVSGITSGVWQNSVSSPTFTWTSGADPEPSRTTDEGKSGVRGQKYYFGTSSTGAFTTFKEGTSGLSYAPGAQPEGTRYFRVGTVDYALNDSSVATFEFKYDATAPNAITAFGSSNPGSSDTDWYNYSGDLVWTWTAATDALSGLDGYAIVQDQSATTQPGATMTHQETTTSYTLSGPQASGEYYLHVRSKDIAGNWLAAGSTAHRRIRIDTTPPAGVSMTIGTVTTDSIAVTGAGTDAHSGLNAATAYNYSRTGASASGATGASYTWTGLTANTEYTGLYVTVSDQAVATPNTAASVPQSQWTLGLAPTAGSVTPDSANPCANSPVTWTAAGFGSGSVEYYRYVFDKNANYVFTDTEPQWSGGTIQTTPDSEGAWYLHVKGYNGANVGNGTFDYAVTARPAAATSAITGNNAVAIGQAGETYLVTLTSGSSYAWTVPSGAVITAGETGPDNNQITVTFGSASGDVTVTETTAESCVGAPLTLAVAVGPNHAPVAPPAKSLSTPMNTPVTVYLVKLLAGATDADGDPLSISAAGPNSVQGGTVVVQGATLIYTPATGYTGADSFTYTISDGQGGTAIGTVNVTVSPPGGGLSPNLVFWPAYADGKFSVTFAGIPGYTYTVEYATQLPPTSGWQKLENYTAGANGLFEVTDIQISPSPARYYRTVYPAY